MMYIKKIDWVDKSVREGHILVSDGKYDLLCFSYLLSPQYNNVGDVINEPLYCNCFDDYKPIYVAKTNEFCLKKIEDEFYAYFICAKVLDVKKGLLCLGKILLELGNILPGDTKVGDYIEFYASRVDLI